MNFSNHYKQLSDDYFILITLSQADNAGYYLASRGFTTMAELSDIGNMLLMGAEMGL
jgi:hypothetical protein